MKKISLSIMVFAILAMTAVSCNSSKKSDGKETNSENKQETVLGNEKESGAVGKTIYEADLQPVNSNLTGLKTVGKARFVMDGETLKVTIDVKNASPGIEHWQHFHGFKNDKIAECSTDAADKNGDGIIDIVETESVSGTTMVPFNKLPAKMDVGADTYPKADENGTYHYEAEIPMANLASAFEDAFGGSIDLDRRVLYIHGVPSNTDLPKSVASLGDIPVQVTLPIACGKIVKVEE